MTAIPAPPGAADDAPSAALCALARAAGIAVDWTDHAGLPHRVAAPTLRALLQALGHPCDDAAAIDASLAALAAPARLPALATARVGEPVWLPWAAGDGAVSAWVAAPGDAARALAVRRAPSPGGAPGLALGPLDAPGYHHVTLAEGGVTQSVEVAIAPQRAFGPLAEAAPARAWGLAVQLHALRPARALQDLDAGLGDFGALATLARSAAAAGADALLISPTHAGFAADPAQCSPYSPSSRLARNVLLIDPAGVAGAAAARAAAQAAGLGDELRALRALALIDWPRAGRAKLRWLRALFDAYGGAAPAAALAPAQQRHAVFEALQAHFAAGRPGAPPPWPAWPAAYHDPGGAAVADFAARHAREVAFHAWLQQQAEAGLQRAQQAARAAGMRIGLVADLAVGLAPTGSHAWAAPGELLCGLEIGAPPDPLGPAGQGWGLTSFSPRALAAQALRPFIELLRAAMRHAGGVRIDHVLGLQRLWLVPRGAPPTAGAYLHLPLRDLLNLVILESHRQRAIVIGEDLGTVPAGLRELLADAGILGMQVLWFQRGEGGAFLPPAQWSAQAVALTTTHDLPTVAGWWQGRDIDWHEAVGTAPDAPAARARRLHERAALLGAAGVPAGDGTEATATTALGAAVDLVARTPAPLAIVPLEDLLGLPEQPNLPGTVDQHPNWRRRHDAPADALLQAAPAQRALAILQRRRPRG